MANTGRIAGKDVYVTFAGTDLSPDFTSVSVNNEGELVDVTAGSDTYHYFVSLARVNGTVDYECFYNGGTTTEWEAIAPNTAGTLIIAPKGTAAGNPCWTCTRALVQNQNIDFPFDDGVKVTAAFQLSATLAETVY